jgi:hypothetical protein
MFQRKFYGSAITFLILLGLVLSSVVLQAQKKDKDKARQKEELAASAQGTPVLWQQPTDISSRDLFLGPGGEAMKPDLSRVTYIKDEEGGYSVKFRVRDGAGKTWVAKLGNEAQPETAAVRLVWAVGYVTEVNYLIPCVRIENAPKPRKDVERCEGGGFANVRFEARPKEIKRLEDWSWKNNPFTGTKEFQGLVVLMALLNNWDLKDANNKILLVPAQNTESSVAVNQIPVTQNMSNQNTSSQDTTNQATNNQDTSNQNTDNQSTNSQSANNPTANNQSANNQNTKSAPDNANKSDAGSQENQLQYIISDLGATFGKTGNAITHNRNKPETFIKTKFINKVEGDRVVFDYHGKDTGLFRNITVEQAKWIGALLSKLSDQQISDAFRAANYSPEEIKTLTEAVRARINELVNLPAPQTAMSGRR